MKEALVIHPWFRVFGGGELLCLYVCKTLQDNGYHVSLVTDIFEPEKAESMYGMGDVMKRCGHVQVPPFEPRHLPIPRLNLFAVQKIFHTRKVKKQVTKLEADVLFSTQSSVFLLPGIPSYHFLYNVTDLFAFPTSLSADAIKAYVGNAKGLSFRWKAYYWLLARTCDLLVGKPDPELFFALSHQVETDLIERGFRNVEMIYPPGRLDVFKPLLKKKQVVTACRVVPPKRLEDFFEIARRLPDYHFILVGRDSPDLKDLYRGYSENLMRNKPENVQYVEAALKDRPELLEESMAYLYCGVEAGIGIAVMEAAGAGCIPITPNIGGGSEVINGLGLGLTFGTIEEGVRKVKLALDEAPWGPDEVRERAVKAFGSDRFERRIRELVS